MALRLAESGAALLGAQLVSARPLAGGDLSAIVGIELEDGRMAAVKNGPSPPTEATMLKALSDASAPAPEVLAVNNEILVLSWIDGKDSVSSAWSALGSVVRTLHSAQGPRYGWPFNYAFGALAIDNTWSQNWPDFWLQRRLLPLIDPKLPPELSRRIEKLASDLGNRLPQHPKPSLLHGDLWSGNIMVHNQGIAGLIDPACYYGDGEVDIAMLQVFDTPPDAFFNAYGALPHGFRERLAIYRLWPALVHAHLFGPSYFPLLEEQLRQAGA